MKKLGCLLLSGIMVGSMTLPVFGWTSHPVDMSKVDVLIEGEKVYDGQTGTVLKEPVVTEEKTYNLPNGLKGFKDVPNASFWAYDAVMSMTEMGLFSGTTAPDSNGMGLFSPDYKMTKAQFITVVTRYLFANSLANMTAEGPWYAPNWNIAVEMGILTEDDFGGVEYLNTPISRQEMAYIITNVLKYKEDLPTSLIDKSQIADYHTIGGYYADYVRTCYSAGILAGIDMKGTFAPLATVTRAQGAVILYRLVNPDVRVSVDLDNASNTIKEPNASNYPVFFNPSSSALTGSHDIVFISMSNELNYTKEMSFSLDNYIETDSFCIGEGNEKDPVVGYKAKENYFYMILGFTGYNNFKDLDISNYKVALSKDKGKNLNIADNTYYIFDKTFVEKGDFISGFAVFELPNELKNYLDGGYYLYFLDAENNIISENYFSKDIII